MDEKKNSLTWAGIKLGFGVLIGMKLGDAVIKLATPTIVSLINKKETTSTEKVEDPKDL